MKKMKDYKYNYAINMRCYPSNEQLELAEDEGGASRFVYNRLTALNSELYDLKQVGVYVKSVQDRIEYIESVLSSVSSFKNSAPFLYGIDCQVTLNAFKAYNAAWKSFYRGGGVPAFHKKEYAFSFQTNPHYSSSAKEMNDSTGFYFVDKTHVVMPGIGKIRIKASPKIIGALLSRTAETRMGTVTFSRDSTGDCYISVQLASDEPFKAPYPKTGSAVGFDLNLENFLTDDKNNVVDNPRFLKKSEEKLKKEQHKLSRMAARAKRDGRKLSESRNYQKQRQLVAELHKHISEQRKNFQRVIADHIVKSHDYIFAEDLRVKNMLKNHRLAKAIADVSWRQFLLFVQTAAELRGKFFATVPARNTTQTCSCCGYLMKGDKVLTLSDREWDCPNCGEHHLRDNNSAINILIKGLDLYPV